MRSNLLPLKINKRVLSVQGLASRSPQLDSSSREEMYFLEVQFDEVPQGAAPPRYPHVRLDVDLRLLDPASKVEMARWISAPRRLWWRLWCRLPTSRASPSQAR